MTILETLTVFLEAASVSQKWRRMKPIESRLEKDMAKAFKAQERVFMKGFASLRGEFKEALSDEDWIQIWDRTAAATEQLFLNPIRRAVQLSLFSAASELVANLDIEYSFTLRNPRAIAYIAEHGPKLVSGINDTTQSYLHTVIQEGIEGGWSYNRMAARITERFVEFAVGVPQQHIESRAHLIAVTETGMAYEAGNAIVAQDLKDAGLKMEKSWLTVGDSRTSDGCRSNEQVGWISIDTAFPSGDMHPLRFPGCRCSTLYRRARG